MKRIIKLSAIIVCVISIGWVVMDIFNKKPLNFNDFKTSEEAQEFLNKKYPKGSSLEVLIHDSKKSGAVCRNATPYELSQHESLKDYVFCDYSYGFLSDIEWTISVQKSGNIVLKILGSKTSTTM